MDLSWGAAGTADLCTHARQVLHAGVTEGRPGEAQWEKHLLPLIRGGRACCFTPTETDAGSDVRSMRTVALPDGDGFRPTGHKVFSPAGPFADFTIVVARMAGSGEQERDKPRFTASTRRPLALPLERTRTRKVAGGQPLPALQAVQHEVADMAAEFCDPGLPALTAGPTAPRSRSSASRTPSVPTT
ncbi:acyl-CoA dehydrogenase family protein [Streptomyces sp. VRA16 Mangrove soil]|uniref:acyl-CoA dehydrogenase family protein n=1 Tax=Streptomyces sp. VRA16 Mangrove soil TaxID=2817434 RepID=UPI001A9D4753|nr:acyl-CoA dehydrogenase family protein [Streptomyces sp. VRA16 Mangrove soil]MBO1335975.1 acyl-CoA dehydrogenase family protein [Streptomyces sp. VRA16 Mangrove soil]